MNTPTNTSASGPVYPYPGLRPFEPNESHLFFGRDEHVFEMFSLLEDHRFLAVVGASGSGKSSLVRAGLLPRLRDEGLLNQRPGAWRFLIMRPGDSPLNALADACHRQESVTGTPLAQGELHGRDPFMTRVVLESGPKGLVRVLADARVPDDDNVLVLVDQFEEVFRFAGLDEPAAAAQTTSRRRNESLQFAALLLETAQQTERPVHVVLTMRTDFIGDCDQFDGLPEAINTGQFLVPRLSWRQLELAITGPLRVPGFECEIDRAIVDHMLNAASHERDALPLVQHALLRMWLTAAGSDAQHPRDGESTRHITETEHYLPIGSLSHALNLHATELYESLAAGQQRIAERLFRCLAVRSPKGQLIRRLTSIQEVADVAGVTPGEVIEVVEVFRQPGVNFLLTSPAGTPTAATSIDISHESLLRQWKLLQKWIEEESEAAAGYRRLIDAVNQGEGVIDSVRLDRAIEWRDAVRPTPAWAKRYGEAQQAEDSQLSQCLQLIEDSLAARESQRQAAEQDRLEREQAQARELELAQNLAAEHTARAQTFRRMLIAVGIAAVIAILLSVWAFLAEHEAKTQREQAETSLKSANHNLGLALLERAKAYHQQGKHTRAYLTAGRAIGFQGLGSPFPDNSALLTPGTDEFTRAVTFARASAPFVIVPRKLFDFETYVGPLASHPTLPMVAIPGKNGNIEIWNTSTGARDYSLGIAGQERDAGDYVYCLAFDCDGIRLLETRLSEVILWDLKTREPLRIGSTQEAYRACFSPDGRKCLWGGNDGRARLFDIDSGETEFFDTPGNSDVMAVGFLHDARRIVVGCENGSLHVLDIAAREWHSETAHERFIWSVACHLERNEFVSVGFDGVIRVWQIAESDPNPLKLVGSVARAHDDQIYWVTYSSDGQRIATASLDGTARVWNAKSLQLLQTLDAHEGIVGGVAFVTRDSRTIATVGADGQLLVWALPDSPEFFSRLTGHSFIVHGLDVHPAGDILASGAWDGTARLWDLKTGESESIIDLEGDEKVTTVRFVPGGSRLIAASDQGSVIGFDMQSRKRVFHWTQEPKAWITSLAISNNGKLVATVDMDTLLSVRGADTGAHTSKSPIHLDSGGSDVAFSDDDALLFAADDSGQISAWNTNDWSPKWTAQVHRSRPTHCKLCYRKGYLFSCNFSDGRICQIDCATGEYVALWETKPPQNFLAMRPVPDTDLLVVTTSGRDSGVIVWDSRTRTTKEILRVDNKYLRDVAISPDGKWIAYADGDHTIRFLSLVDPEQPPLDSSAFRFEGLDVKFKVR